MILRLDRVGVELPPINAVFAGPHPETGEELVVEDGPPDGAVPNDLPAQPDVFAPDYAPEEIAKIAAKLRDEAGLPKHTSRGKTKAHARARPMTTSRRRS
jgi:hypothetical protein